ncbi:MAG TPA: class I SAM-dependent methyltransferase [Burkholderiales bacterium]|nr:class I SAM-dependent methyltransferase [Burkholderiales bacterium]
MSLAPSRRFSRRADHYARFRPGYPDAVLAYLAAECGLERSSRVADVGSGTGLLARMFLEFGCTVYGIEPNREMRDAGETALAGMKNFISVDGFAERSTLPDASVDLVIAGQAFHWFDHALARTEFRRILRGRARIALLWNYRRPDASAFMRGYEALLRRYCPEYPQLLDPERHRGEVIAFFSGGKVSEFSLDNRQTLDFEALEGRHLSQSYVPLEGESFEPMMRELRAIYDAHQRNGSIAVDYETRMYCGSLSG